MHHLVQKILAGVLGLCLLIGGFLLLTFGLVAGLVALFVLVILAAIGMRRSGGVVVIRRWGGTQGPSDQRQPFGGAGATSEQDAAQTCVELDATAYSGQSRPDEPRTGQGGVLPPSPSGRE